MTRMNCKLKKPDDTICGVLIDYDPDTKKATNASDGSDHFHPKKKNFSSGKAIDADLELLGKISSVEARVDTLEQAVKALVAQSKVDTIG